MKSLQKSSKLNDELSGSRSSSNRLGKSRKGGRLKQLAKPRVEKQGPVDWSCYALKVKYRGEKEREDAWQLWMSSTTQAQKSLAESDIILPVVKIERHPFYIQYFQRLDIENALSSTRTRNRLLMKRFVFDVQEIWLTNLQHLREHDATFMYATADATAGKVSKGGVAATPVIEDEEEEEAAEGPAENFGRGNGLVDRRDTKAITSMDCQIQSVSQKRAFARAYHTSRLPPVGVMLDYEASQTAVLKDIKLLPPSIENLMSGVKISLPLPSSNSTNTSSVESSSNSSSRADEMRSQHGLIVPVMHSSAMYPELVYMLHVDRLLPSKDYQRDIQSEVLWRFTLYRNDDVAGQVYISPEPVIANYVTSILLKKAEVERESQGVGSSSQEQSADAVTPLPLLCSGLVFMTTDSVLVPIVTQSAPAFERSGAVMESSYEIPITFSVAVLGFTRALRNVEAAACYFDCVQQPDLLTERLHLLHAVKLEICVELAEAEQYGLAADTKLFLECSPAELRFLLQAPDAPLGDIQWWVDPLRTEDTWPVLAKHLVLETASPLQGHIPSANATENSDPSSASAGSKLQLPEPPVLALRMSAQQRQERFSAGSGVAQTAPEHVSGALSTLQALSCAYELLDLVRLVPGAQFSEEQVKELLDESPSSAYTDHIRPNQMQAPHVLHLHAAPDDIFMHVDTQHRIEPHFLFPPEEYDCRQFAEEYRAGSPMLGYAPPQTPLLYFDDNVRIDSANSERPPSRTAASNTNASTTHALITAAVSANEAEADVLVPFQQASAAAAASAVGVTRSRLFVGVWEGIADTGSASSLITCGALPTVAQVPGACEYGRRGLWFPDHVSAPVEYTQAAAKFFRGGRLSSSNSIFVNMTLALDTALMVPTELAWEAFSSYPAATPAEEVLPIVPCLTQLPQTLCVEKLRSPLELRVSSTVMVFTSLPIEGIDHIPLDTVPKPAGFSRHRPVANEFGYREQVEVTLLGVDPVLATMVFGITKTGAVVNSTGVNNRNMWHNTLAVTEHICRPRAPKDYLYLLMQDTHHGPNEPTRYTTRMHGQRMVGLTSSAFSEFEDSYNEIQQLRDVFNKQLALDAKIEKVQNDIKLKNNLHRMRIQQQLQRKFEKRIRKATRTELGWRNRFKMSSLLEVQGNWERRRDERTGMFFFHCLAPERRPGTPHIDLGPGERFAESCQWEIPAHWDGDPLSTDMHGGKQFAANTYSAYQQQQQQQQQRPAQSGQPPLAAGRQRGRGTAAAGQNGIADMDGGGAQSSVGFDALSELQDEDLDHFDMAPSQFDPHQEPQLQMQQKMLQEAQSAQGSKAGGRLDAFEQPPDNWLPGASTGGAAVATPKADSSSILSIRRNGAGRHTRQTADDATTTDMDSVAADRSLAESVAATIDTVNLEHIAEQLVSSDELMRVIARRLGLSENQVVPADELSSVFSVSSMGEKSQNSRFDMGDLPAGVDAADDGVNEAGALNAPRDNWIDPIDEPEFDSDDDLWSDDDHEVGDFDEVKELGAREDMPETQLEAAQLRRRELRAERAGRKSDTSVPSQVPALDLLPITKQNKLMDGAFLSDDGETREEVFGWRRLPRPMIRPGFLSDALLTHTKPPDPDSSNTLNAPIFLMPISPVDACKYVPEELALAVESIFVPDAKKDMERSIATVERNIRREEELARNMPTDDLLLFGEAKEFTSADAFLARQMKEDQDVVADPREEAVTKSILAAKSSNIAMMEDALAEDIPVNTADQYGNTLLILAAQQGSKRMCKFLLRRGANINLQSLAGNTPLHYCYAYTNIGLAEYLKAKGADDSIVNVDGLTCYEGLSRESMNEQYGDDEEAYFQGDDNDDSDSDNSAAPYLLTNS